MGSDYKNYIRVKTIDDYYIEHIDNYEITFDKYKRINLWIDGDYCFGHRSFNYNGRSIKQLMNDIQKHIIHINGDYFTIYDIKYNQFILEVIDIQVPDNPKENKIFENFSDLYLRCSDEGIIYVLPKIKEYINENLIKEKDTYIEFPNIIRLEYPKYSYFLINGKYGYNKFGKPSCKLTKFTYNPGGCLLHSESHNLTKIQNLIKEYVES